jgi:hypothetical protein
VFSTYLYTGNSSTQTITNGIDLSTKGGLVWTKNRSSTQGNAVFDTVRGNTKYLLTQTTDADQTSTDDITGFLSNGYTLGNNATTGNTNYTNYTYASWTFREQPKFFDIVTYTGDGVAGRTVSHNLGSTPGCIIVKKTSGADAWAVYHRSESSKYAYLNQTAAFSSSFPENVFGNGTSVVAPTSTQFTVGPNSEVNGNGSTYVAYLFAHDAGGFGLTGSDNVISCGSYTGNGSTSGPTVTLGYEPQWLMIKTSTTTGSWQMIDNMRGMVVGGNEARLLANSSSAELSNDYLSPTATGFQLVSTSSEVNGNGQTYIYIAIRRGPMKTPTVGTSVFSPNSSSASTGTKITTDFPIDMQIWGLRADGGSSKRLVDRLRGVSSNTTTSGVALFTDLTDAEDSASASTRYFDNTGFTIPNTFVSGLSTIYWSFRRAPGFFDVVCYTGDGASSRSITHNLGVKPEFIIVKRRSSTGYWATGHGTSGLLFALNTTNAGTSSTSTAGVSANGYVWIDDGTTTTFKVIAGDTDSTAVNASGSTYVAYLFASVSGVSKVGSYTGTGALQTVNCGFTTGARFVLIKRTDSTGDWWVYDSARGISSGNDPYLFLNSSAAEVTGTNYVDTTSVGFQVTAAAPAGLNANGGTFIFLAVA